MQQENFQSAFDAEANKQNAFAVAEFRDCQDSYQAQWFSHDSNGRLSTENGQKCLTALPISAWSHLNLNSCDTWDGYTGAGTYLFSMDCGLEQDFGFGQSFGFDVTAEFGGVVTSDCDHGFFLGYTADGKAFLTDSEDSFETAVVASGIRGNLPRNCATLGCSHACFQNETMEFECACPRDFNLALDDVSCEPSNNNSPALSTSFLSADSTWRPIISNMDQCIKKKYSGFEAGQQIFLTDCNPDHPKTQWLYSEDSGQISAKNFPEFCVQDSGGSNKRVTMQLCDDDMPGSQSFDYDVELGRIFVRGTARCLSINENNGAVVTLNRCWASSFGYFE